MSFSISIVLKFNDKGKLECPNLKASNFDSILEIVFFQIWTVIHLNRLDAMHITRFLLSTTYVRHADIYFIKKQY
jgi:hypothetical protein